MDSQSQRRGGSAEEEKKQTTVRSVTANQRRASDTRMLASLCVQNACNTGALVDVLAKESGCDNLDMRLLGVSECVPRVNSYVCAIFSFAAELVQERRQDAGMSRMR